MHVTFRVSECHCSGPNNEHDVLWVWDGGASGHPKKEVASIAETKESFLSSDVKVEVSFFGSQIFLHLFRNIFFFSDTI
jgi:hypothetical protein